MDVLVAAWHSPSLILKTSVDVLGSQCVKDKDSEPSQMTPPTSSYDKPLMSYSKKRIDQSEEGAELKYTNWGQGLWTKSTDTIHKFVRQTVDEL